MLGTLSKSGEIAKSPDSRVRSSSAPPTKSAARHLKFRSSRLYLLMVFARQFATLVRAGIPISTSIANLARQSDDEAFALLLESVRIDLGKGHSLSAAFSRQPSLFDTTLVSIIRAGEMSGTLPEMMDKMAYLLEREYALQRKILSSLTYPAIIMVVMVTATLILTEYIFPKFMTALGTSIELPWPTKVLLFMTHAMESPLFWILLILAGAWGFIRFRKLRNEPDGRMRLERLALRIPVLGTALKKIMLARFCFNLATLLDCGIPIIRSMELSGAATGSPTVAKLVDRIKTHVKNGKKVAYAFSTEQFLPPLMYQIVGVGEQTGEYSRVLRTLARFFELDADGALETIVNLLEPAGIISMGLIVGFVLVAVFWPLLKITTAL